MKCLLVYNPYSGHQKFHKLVPFLEKKLNEIGYLVDVFASNKIGSIYDKIYLDAEKYDLVYVSGGDGTLHEVINSLMKLNPKSRPNIYYYPSGTLNDFAKSFKLKVSIKNSIKIIEESNIKRFDVIKVNTQYFIYASAFGKFTSVSYKNQHKCKKFFGRFFYYFSIISNLFSKYNQEVECSFNDENIQYKNYVTFFLNTRKVGGFKIHRKEKVYFNDNELNLTIIKKSFFSFFNLLLFFVFGEHYHSHNIIQRKVQEIKIKSPTPIFLNGDGELLSCDQSFDIRMKEDKYIHIYLPKKVNGFFK